MRVLFKYVLVKPDQENTETEAGIAIPEMALKKPHKGVVLEVGEEVTKVKKGETVLYKRWGGNEWDEDILIEEEDIMVVL